MRVARLHAIGDVRVADEPEPSAAEGETLIRVTAVGLCGSDLHWYAEASIGDAVVTRPLVLGHEFAGVIAAGPRAGERVAVDPAVPCDSCDMCYEGRRHMCRNGRFAGHGRTDGALRELIAWPTALLHPIPDSLSAADGAVLEPLGVALHTFDLARPRVATEVGVIGCGPIGLLLVQLAAAAGMIVRLAVDPLAHRRDAAKAFGAEVVLTPEEARDTATLDDVVGGGLAATFEAAGTDDAVEIAMLAARPASRVALAGIPEADRTAFPAAIARRKGLSLLVVRRMKDSVYPRAIWLAERGLVDLPAMVTARFPLEQAQDAFRTAASRDGLKVVVEPAAHG